ncbi:MAG: hypothetical protein IIW48_09760 [Clostridia bacterium]|nr:hypothetical protein [Clostridia bacterium]
MAYNNNSTAYDLSLFAPAPKRKSESQPKQNPQPKLVKPRLKTKEELEEEAVAIRVRAIRFVSVLVVGMLLLGTNIMLHIQDNELNNAIVELDKGLAEKKSEYTKLTSLFSAKFSPDNAKAYAESQGMVKRERYHIVYFDIDDGNQIISAE